MRKRTLALGVLSIALLTGCVKEMNPNQPFNGDNESVSSRNNMPAWDADSEFVPGELLIKFKPGVSLTGRANALARISGKVKEHIVTAAMKHYGDNEGLHLVSVPNGVLQAIERLKDLADVEYAEPNFIYRHGDPVSQATPIEVSYSDGTMWGMYGDATTPKNAFGSQAGEAWAAGYTGSNIAPNAVYVGIIDEGIKYDHPDLDVNIWTNPFDAVDGIDNDGNGLVDDYRGWDFANGDNSIYDGADNHGTHVAGTIGAKANNQVTIDGRDHRQGVVGVNWDIFMISGKFLGPNGGTTVGAIQAVDYFTDLKKRHGLNIVATNNSWGGGGFSQALLDAITRGAKQNILFIAAAGNGNMLGIGQNNDKKAVYPANYNTKGQTGGTSPLNPDNSTVNYDAVIAVAAIDKNGSLAGFSNYGAKTVELGAPGVGIWSTVGPPDNFAGYSGTSMATPHVTGAVALYKSLRTDANAPAIRLAILKSAIPTKSLSTKCSTNGRLDVYSALLNLSNNSGTY